MELQISGNNRFDLGVDIPIYFTFEYSKIQDQKNLLQIIGKRKEQNLFFLKGTIEGHVFNSLPNSPFGGIVKHQGCTFDQLQEFHSLLIDFLSEKGVEKIILNNPVAQLYPDFVPGKWLKDVGYHQSFCELNQHIDFNHYEIHKMQLRRMKKAKNAGLKFRELHGGEDFEKLYRFIEQARIEQKLTINIDFDRFMQLVSFNDHRYQGWIVENDKDWMAGLFTARVTPKITYYYLPASQKRFNEFSPMVFLLINLYQELTKGGVNTLDMGISSIRGKEQSSLALFKKRMGAEMHNRGSYCISL